MERGPWQATVHGITKSEIQLSARAHTHTHTHMEISTYHKTLLWGQNKINTQCSLKYGRRLIKYECSPSLAEMEDLAVMCGPLKHFLFFFFNFLLFFNFTILYWFCHISKWICHRYTCVPHPEPSSLLPPYTIPLCCPSAPAPSIQYRALTFSIRCDRPEAWEHVTKLKISPRHTSISQFVSKLGTKIPAFLHSSWLSQAILPSHGELWKSCLVGALSHDLGQVLNLS